MAPLKGEWRELKNMAWYRVEIIRSYQSRRHHPGSVGEQNELQAQAITYHCDIQTVDQFGDLFWATACQRNADLYEELVFVCDGAVWIWKLIERHFPHATQIVDWYHASEYLPPIAEGALAKIPPSIMPDLAITYGVDLAVVYMRRLNPLEVEEGSSNYSLFNYFL